MSTVIYSNGMLISDSGNVIERFGDFNFTLVDIPKLFLSSCKLVAIGSAGRVFKTDYYPQMLADVIALTIREYRCLTLKSELLSKTLEQLTVDHGNELSIIVMTSFNELIYLIDTTNTDEGPKYRVDIIRSEDSYGIGSGHFFALTALHAGADPVAAVDFAISRDIFSKHPIHIISRKDLLPYEAKS